ncbi:MAG: sulfotransferase [Planctomycetia bacterium]|nr:sulfotransferase [Planctomycetia bacterium]
MTGLPGDIKVKESGGYKDMMWVPRIWNGMRFSTFMALLAKNHFRVAPYRIPMATINIMAGCFSSTARIWQRLLLDKKIRNTKIEQSPIFIIGHWRSGTTMLHEIMIRDERFSYPDTFSCFAAEHFLLTRGFLTKIIKLPDKRPMDNVSFGWNAPQEDEFALCSMGIPSPYFHLAFPRHIHWPGRYENLQKYLDLSGLTEAEMKRWQNGVLWFLKELTYRDPRRLVLKSPPHTARVGVFHKMFPDAKFIHISRNPYTLYASTVNLWKRFLVSEAFQHSDGEYLQELVFESMERMYRAYFRDKSLLPPNQLIEIKYEDLVEDKLGVMEKVYDQLELGDFENIRGELEKYAEEKKNFKKNKFEISPELKEKISLRWKPYIEYYGYEEA